MKKYGFIGAGNMGLPLIKGAAKLVGAENVTFSARSIERITGVEEQTGVKAVTPGSGMSANCTLVSECEIIILAVKPQMMAGVLSEISVLDLSGKVFVSIAAGLSCETLKNGLMASDNSEINSTKAAPSIVRVMPNTPAMVGEGMSCVCFDEDAKLTTEQEADVMQLLNAVGKTEIIPERLMSAATCANGSSPAYVYMFIEALADSAVKYGITRDMAYRLAAQTVLGSAKMVLETGEHPGKLKDNVCSPGGTTIAAVEALEEWGLRNAVMKATDACYQKSEELAGKKK